MYVFLARPCTVVYQVIPGEFGGVARVTYPGCSVAMATSRSLGDFHFKRNYNSYVPLRYVPFHFRFVTFRYVTLRSLYVVSTSFSVYSFLRA